MSADVLVTALLAGTGSAGVVGAYVALRKLPSDRAGAAVAHADGAMAIMQRLNDELGEALTRAENRGDRWKMRATRAERALRDAGLGLPPLPPDVAALDAELDT